MNIRELAGEAEVHNLWAEGRERKGKGQYQMLLQIARETRAPTFGSWRLLIATNP